MRTSTLLVLSAAGCSPEEVAPASRPPEVYLVSPSDDAHVVAGAPMLVQAVVVDDLDEPADLRVRVMDETGELAAGHPDKIGQFSLTLTLAEGRRQLWLEVEDSEAQAVRRFVRVHADVATVTAATVHVEPVAPITGEPLTAVLDADASFSDQSPYDYLYRWSVDGLPTGFSAAELPADVVRAGEVWEVSVVAYADTSESEPARAFVDIGNAPPTVDEPTVTETDGVASCAHPEPFDPEGDPLEARYTWWLDGARVDGHLREVELPVGPRDAELACTVRVDDGAAWTETSSAGWPLPNHAPDLGAAVVSPTAPGTAEVVDCTLDAPVEDIDGDEVFVEYTWWVDGVEVASGPSLAGEAFERGDTLTCVARGDDGFGGQAVTTSAGVVVQNSPPRAPVVNIVPAEPVAGDTLRCAVGELGVDPDGDALTCATRWELGSPFASGEYVSTSGLRAGTAVRCVVTCTDGQSAGTDGVATVTLSDAIRGETAAGDAMVLLTGEAGTGAFGSDVVVLPDLDGDGGADLGVGAPGVGGGAVWVYTRASLRGAEALDTRAASASWRGALGDALGSLGALAGAGDLDGDGQDDVLVGAPTRDGVGVDAGEAWVVRGGAALGLDAPIDELAVWSVVGEAGDRLGARLAGGDLDGDGLAEAVFAAPGSALGGDGAGAVAIFAGRTDGAGGQLDLADSDGLFVGNAGDGVGTALAVCPDADGDGRAELAVGASGAEAYGRAGAGSVWAVAGDTVEGWAPLGGAAWLRLAGDDAQDALGTALVCPGDLDDDGLGELVVGAPGADGGAADAGVVAVYFGRAEPDLGLVLADADATFPGTGASSALGVALALGGDLDHDGLVDLVAGAPGGLGLVHIFRSTGMDRWSPEGAAADASIAGNDSTDAIGRALAGGLDLEDDGFAELVMGAPLAGGGVGAAYVFTGR